MNAVVHTGDGDCILGLAGGEGQGSGRGLVVRAGVG